MRILVFLLEIEFEIVPQKHVVVLKGKYMSSSYSILYIKYIKFNKIDLYRMCRHLVVYFVSNSCLSHKK